ncbi:putative proline/betaine transporter [Rickettsia amblyommatis str. Darkwater]|nr:hypothetical protein [Rickettsia amblyommatis]KJV93061.1 putative proline/betaine transporter [Rickettsia amblyommatis str. Darkwater]
MVTLPSYEVISIKAVWLVTACRVIQGMASMGEIVGAELYLAETIQLPARYMVVSIIGVFGTLGAKFALGILQPNVPTTLGGNCKLKKRCSEAT